MEAMKNINKFKLALTVFLGFVLGIVGISKIDQINKPASLDGQKIASAQNDNPEVCSVKDAKDNTSLFVSCSGFLE